MRASGEVLLFDLVADPTEQVDLAGSQPEVLQACRRTYRAALREGRLTDFAAVITAAEAAEAERRLDLDELRDLGYVQ